MNARIRAVTGSKRRLELIAKNAIGEVVVFMDSHLDNTINQLRMEPPPKAGSRYVRTHTYSTGWHRSDIRQTKEGLVGSIINNATDPRGNRYAVLVGGNEAGEGQLEMHNTTGWPLAAEVLRTDYIDGLRDAVHNGLRG